MKVHFNGNMDGLTERLPKLLCYKMLKIIAFLCSAFLYFFPEFLCGI